MSNFADKLAAATGRQQPQGPQGPPVKDPNQSVPVEDPLRAGRAPYNFVPLPAKARWLKDSEAPPPQDVVVDGLFSGAIEVELRALTRFYLRGMSSLDDYVKSAEQSKKPQNAAPFTVNGRLCLPGSSLRGMIRNLVEIMGEAPLDMLNDTQLFFRTVGSSSNPSDRTSFEPHSKAYKDRIDWQRGTVKAGYIRPHRDNDQWTIQPALSVEGRQCYKVALVPKRQDFFRDPTKQWKKGRKIWFRADSRLGRAEISENPIAGYEQGCLLYTGGIPKKRHQWVLRPMNPQTAAVKIPAADVVAYREGGISQAISKHDFAFSPLNPPFQYSQENPGTPCFYVEWRGPDEVKHLSFGHTYNFRLPYEHTVGQAVPEPNQRIGDLKRWDLAQAMFGRTTNQVTGVPGARGRLFFEDALLTESPPSPIQTNDLRVALGQPNPTTFQHYLVQRQTDVINSIHWDGNYKGEGKAVIRGHKLYFHRPNAPVRTGGGKENVESRFYPASAGCVFTARIRFDQLRDWEIGALLAALELPQGCAHRLGMAKPLGLGSFSATVRKVDLIDWKQRYGWLGDPATGVLETGISPATPKQRFGWSDAFAVWLAGPKKTLKDLWDTPRWSELRALLTIDSLPADWSSRTRYLEFGSIQGRSYNEYKSVPNSRELQQRRPLPPASQVLADGRLPNDPLPQFDEKRRE